MNANYMKFALLNIVDRASSLSAPGYDDRQISEFLNRAQDIFYMTKYNPLGNKYRQGYEQSEKRRADLKELVSTAIISGEYNTGRVKYTAIVKANSNIVNIRAYVSPITRFISGGVTTAQTSIPIGIAEGAPLHTVNSAGVADNNIPVDFVDAITGDTIITKIIQVLGGDAINGYNVKINTIAATDQQYLGTLANPGYVFSGIGISFDQMDTNPNGIILDLPYTYLLASMENAKTVLVPTRYVPVIPKTHDSYNPNINNPFDKPYNNKVWKFDISRRNKGLGEENDDDGSGNDRPTNKRIELIVSPESWIVKDSNSPTPLYEYYLRYIKYPRRIYVDEYTPSNQVSCELDESTHNEIVQIAARLATVAIEPQKYQIMDAEEQKSE
jgi:hypothetical protein